MSSDDAGNGGEGEPAHEWDLDSVDFGEPAAGTQDAGRLAARVQQLEQQLAEERNRALRLLADMQNVQRRGVQNERVARQQGVGAVVASIVPVVDHFDMALTQDPRTATAESIISGVRVIREELLRALASQGVASVVPQPGDEFVPGKHEALSQQPGNGIEPGRILMTYQAGFVLVEGETQRVLRPAKVVVAS